MAIPDNEFTNDVDGMRDVDGQIRLHSDFPYTPLRENKFEFEAGPIIALCFSIIVLIGIAVGVVWTTWGYFR